MSFPSYLRALRRSWWLILLVTVLGIGGGALWYAQSTPLYASSVTFWVRTPGAAAGGSSQYADDQFAERRANSYVSLLSSLELANRILSSTPLGMSPGAVAAEISGTAEINTVLLKASVRDTSPERALRIATAVKAQLPRLVDELENTGLKSPAVLLVAFDGPRKPVHVAPRRSVDLGLGFGAGLVIGLLLAIGRELLDRTVRTPAGLAEVTDLPVLGVVALDPNARRAPLIVGDESNSARAEAMRQLRTSLQFVDVDRPRPVLVLTSATAGEGKSMTAANLAIAFAEVQARVLLIDGDLRRPSVTTYLGVAGDAGLSNVLAGQVDLADVLQPWGELTVLPSGPTPPNVSAMLDSRRMRDLIAEVRASYDVVIIDAPPVLPVTDATLLGTMADGVVVVARHGRVTRQQVRSAVSSLDGVGASVLGFVLNMIPKRQTKEYGGTYDAYRSHSNTMDASLLGELVATEVRNAAEVRSGNGAAHRASARDGGPGRQRQDLGSQGDGS